MEFTGFTRMPLFCIHARESVIRTSFGKQKQIRVNLVNSVNRVMWSGVRQNLCSVRI